MILRLQFWQYFAEDYGFQKQNEKQLPLPPSANNKVQVQNF